MVLIAVHRRQSPWATCGCQCQSLIVRARQALSPLGHAATRTPLHPAALAFVSYGVVLVRIRVRDPRLVLEHRFLMFHCPTPRAALHVRQCALLQKRQGPPMAVLRSLVVAARFSSDNLMVAASDLRNVPPLLLHIWRNLPPLSLHDTSSTCPCCCSRSFGGLGIAHLMQVTIRARAFVTAQLIHMSLLRMLPWRAPRTAGRSERRTPHPISCEAHERAGAGTIQTSLSRSGRHAEAIRTEVGRVGMEPTATHAAAARRERPKQIAAAAITCRSSKSSKCQTRF